MSPSSRSPWKGTRDELEVPSAEEVSAHVHDGVFGVELAVGVLEGLLYAFDVLDDVEGTDEVLVHDGGVADESHDGGVVALAHVDVEAQPLDPLDKVVHLLFIGVVFDDDDHDFLLLFRSNKKTAGMAVRVCSLNTLSAHTETRALKVKALKVEVCEVCSAYGFHSLHR